VDHEEWWSQCKFYYQRRRDLITDWLRDRGELLNRIKNVLYEASVSSLLEESKLENRQKQREICDALYAKVQNQQQHLFQFILFNISCFYEAIAWHIFLIMWEIFVVDLLSRFFLDFGRAF